MSTETNNYWLLLILILRFLSRCVEVYRSVCNFFYLLWNGNGLANLSQSWKLWRLAMLYSSIALENTHPRLLH